MSGKRKRAVNPFRVTKRQAIAKAKHQSVARFHWTQSSDRPRAAHITIMGDNDMDGLKNDANNWKGGLIPGVDGQRYFGFPPNVITKLHYIDSATLTSTVGTIGFNAYRLNGIFDPNATGAGHQPMFFDQFTPIYRNYRVLGSKISVRFIAGTDLVGPWWIGINGSEVSTSLGSQPFNRAEMNDSTYSTLGPRNGDEGLKRLTWTYSPEQSLGKTETEDSIASLVTTNPASEYFAQVWMADAQGATSTIYIEMEIEYTVEFFGLQTNAGS